MKDNTDDIDSLVEEELRNSVASSEGPKQGIMKVQISTKSAAVGRAESSGSEDASSQMFKDLFSGSSTKAEDVSSDRGNSRSGDRKKKDDDVKLKKQPSKKDLKNKFRSSSAI